MCVQMKPSMSAFSAPTSEHLLAAVPVSSATSYHSATSSVKSSSPAVSSKEIPLQAELLCLDMLLRWLLLHDR